MCSLGLLGSIVQGPMVACQVYGTRLNTIIADGSGIRLSRPKVCTISQQISPNKRSIDIAIQLYETMRFK